MMGMMGAGAGGHGGMGAEHAAGMARDTAQTEYLGTTVRVRGLSHAATKEHVARFFRDVKLTVPDVEDSISFAYDPTTGARAPEVHSSSESSCFVACEN